MFKYTECITVGDYRILMGQYLYSEIKSNVQ